MKANVRRLCVASYEEAKAYDVEDTMNEIRDTFFPTLTKREDVYARHMASVNYDSFGKLTDNHIFCYYEDECMEIVMKHNQDAQAGLKVAMRLKRAADREVEKLEALIEKHSFKYGNES